MRPLCDTDRRVARQSAGLWGYLIIPSPYRVARATMRHRSVRTVFSSIGDVTTKCRGCGRVRDLAWPVPQVGTHREIGQSARVGHLRECWRAQWDRRWPA